MNSRSLAHGTALTATLVLAAGSTLALGPSTAGAAPAGPTATAHCTGYGEPAQVASAVIRTVAHPYTPVGLVELCQRYTANGWIRWTAVTLNNAPAGNGFANGDLEYRPTSGQDEPGAVHCQPGGTGAIVGAKRTCASASVAVLQKWQDLAEGNVYNNNNVLIATGRTLWMNWSDS
ncbi:hypothetical protein [Kribbella sp. CA-293567]|uniref:hypothetical protein n=1 Tax=Kribbella sp. CA-293567 TaxID=3002436 RepID=UPI0022DE0B9F|nr:hypothetical protein [Kribbella sp. CA-293567]WBQ08142.1 hypothetical protein OX958_15370 [Kribbella sp. CA-293567]